MKKILKDKIKYKHKTKHKKWRNSCGNDVELYGGCKKNNIMGVLTLWNEIEQKKLKVMMLSS